MSKGWLEKQLSYRDDVKENNRVSVDMRRYNRSGVNKVKHKKFIVAMRGNCRATATVCVCMR